jgi:ATP-binding cassette, subfamily B, bacterial
MDNLCRFADRPIAFFVRYVRMRPISHALIAAAVLAAVSCSVSTQYGVKFLVDTLAGHDTARVWTAFTLLSWASPAICATISSVT